MPRFERASSAPYAGPRGSGHGGAGIGRSGAGEIGDAFFAD